MSKSQDSRFNQLVKSAITDTLKPLGFRKEGAAYILDRREVNWIVDPQKSNRNTDLELSFTINAGIHVPGLMKLYMNMEEPKSPLVAYCCIWTQIGILAPDRKACWWNLRADDIGDLVDGVVINEIRTRINRDVLPFLQRFESVDSVMSYLAAPRDRNEKGIFPSDALSTVFLGLIQVLAGDTHKGCEYLSAAVKHTNSHAAQSSFRAIRDRICSQFPESVER